MNKQLIKNFISEKVKMLTNMNTYYIGEIDNKGLMAMFDLNISEANIVWYLYNSKRDASIAEIIESQHISKFTTSRSVSKLIKLGLIERYQKSENLRFSYIKLTEKGWEACKADVKNVIYEYNFLLDKICTDEELEQVINDISAINNILGRINKYSVSQLQEELRQQNI